MAIADEAGRRRVDELRIALADAQRWAGLMGSRGHQVAHLTLGYGDKLPEECRPIPSFRFHVGAVDLVVGNTGRSEHLRLDRWQLRQGGSPSSPCPPGWHQSCRFRTCRAEPQR